MSRVALLHSPQASARSTTAIREALRAAGHEALMLAAGPNLAARLAELQPDAVFNNAPGLRRKSEQPHIVAALEMAGVPFTGSGLAAQIICQHKGLAKRVLAHAGVPTADFAVLRDQGDLERLLAAERPAFGYPALLKPEAEGSSFGIGTDSVVTDADGLRRLAERLWREFPGPILVEAFLPGREFTVGVLGEPPAVLPPVEIAFDGTGYYTHQVKEADAVETICPARTTPELAAELQRLALAAFLAVGARDYARVDIRLDEAGWPFVLEINAQPGMVPGYSDFPKAAAAAGITYEELVAHLVQLALGRGRGDGHVAAAPV